MMSIYGIDVGRWHANKVRNVYTRNDDNVREQQSGSLSSLRKWSAGDSQGYALVVWSQQMANDILPLAINPRYWAKM
jgi:hypothetical protein